MIDRNTSNCNSASKLLKKCIKIKEKENGIFK